MASPALKPLVLKHPKPHPNPVKPVTKGLRLLTLESCMPPPPLPITFDHEGGVPQHYSKSKNIPQWSFLLVRKL